MLIYYKDNDPINIDVVYSIKLSKNPNTLIFDNSKWTFDSEEEMQYVSEYIKTNFCRVIPIK